MRTHPALTGIRNEWEEHPLRLIIILAVFFRLIAVVFSKGFGWFDDHFLIIEASQSWVDGFDYNRWLPWSEGNTGPGGHNMFYTGLHFLFFKLCAIIGFNDPQGKMYVVRLLHAALSMVVVVLGYRMTHKLAGKNAAKLAGILLAILWVFPFISVRNLVEFTCVPFLLWGSWMFIKYEKPERPLLLGLLAGIILGVAFSIRFQSMVYIGGIGLSLLILGRWKEAVATGFGVLIAAFVFLGSIDIFIWGYPFAEFIEYVNYNMHNYTEYPEGPWYQYIIVIFSVLIPPVSFFLVFGFFRSFIKSWKKYLIIFLPVLLFIIFHSYYPNKQERFILPIIPFMIIAGSAGWVYFREQSAFWKKRKLLLNTCWGFFWTINIAALIVISTTYSKKARVESMTYLSKYENIRVIMVENSNKSYINFLPMYYLGLWIGYEEITNQRTAEELAAGYNRPNAVLPDFIIFEGENHIDARIAAVQSYFPDYELETIVSPGMIDRILFWLNPINENQNAYIYRNTQLHPNKIE